jgi:hypothetical protein
LITLAEPAHVMDVRRVPRDETIVERDLENNMELPDTDLPSTRDLSHSAAAASPAAARPEWDR